MMFLFFSSVLHGNQQNRIKVRYHYKELIEIRKERILKTRALTLCTKLMVKS